MRVHVPTARGVPTSHTRTRLRDRSRSLRLQARRSAPGSNIYKNRPPEPATAAGAPDGASRERSWCGETSSRWGCYACGLNSSAGLSLALWLTNGTGSPRGASRRAPQGSLRALEFLSRGLRLLLVDHVRASVERLRGVVASWARFSFSEANRAGAASSGHSQYPSSTPVQQPRAKTRRRGDLWRRALRIKERFFWDSGAHCK